MKVVLGYKLIHFRTTGASHADDTAYVLRNVYGNVEDSELDKSLVSTMVNVWTSFAFTG